MEIADTIFLVCSILLTPYIFLIIFYAIGWNMLKECKTEKFSPKNYISIVIAVRNEVDNLPALLDCLSRQTYPRNLFEIIFVNDHSDDNSVELISNYKEKNKSLDITILNLSGEETSKKTAIVKGVEQAKGDLILTTDADCTFEETWIESIASFYEKNNVQLIVSPVKLDNKRNVFSSLQIIEFSALIGTTGGSLFFNLPLMSNGANLAFERNFCIRVAPSAFRHEIASGDDMFLMLAAKKDASSNVLFNKCKSAVVTTKTKPNVKGFISQRKRWVSKGKNYKDFWLIFNSLSVFMANASLLFLFIYSIIDTPQFVPFLILLGAKSLVDFVLMASTLKWLKSAKHLWVFPLAAVLNIIYVVFIAIYGSIGKYNWKGRRVR